MEVSHFLSLIDFLCVVNILYSEDSDGSWLRQNKLVVTVHQKPQEEIATLVFGYEEESFTLLSGGHYKSTCAVFILLLEFKRWRPITETTENSKLLQNSSSKLRYYIPRRKYFAVFSDAEFFEALDTLITIICRIEHCHIPDNLAFMIQDDSLSKIEYVCTMREKYLTHTKFKFDKKSIQRVEAKFKNKYLLSQMKCIQIQNDSARSLEDIFTQRVNE